MQHEIILLRFACFCQVKTRSHVGFYAVNPGCRFAAAWPTGSAIEQKRKEPEFQASLIPVLFFFVRGLKANVRAADGNRTRDLRTTNATLYRLSHSSTRFRYFVFRYQRRLLVYNILCGLSTVFLKNYKNFFIPFFLFHPASYFS